MYVYWIVTTSAIAMASRWRWLAKKLRTPLSYSVPRATLLNMAIEPMMVCVVEISSATKLVTATMNEALTSAVSIPDMRMFMFFLQRVETTEAPNIMAPRNL